MYNFFMETIKIIYAENIDDSFFTMERLSDTVETSDVSGKVAAIITDVRAKKIPL